MISEEKPRVDEDIYQPAAETLGKQIHQLLRLEGLTEDLKTWGSLSDAQKAGYIQVASKIHAFYQKTIVQVEEVSYHAGRMNGLMSRMGGADA